MSPGTSPEMRRARRAHLRRVRRRRAIAAGAVAAAVAAGAVGLARGGGSAEDAGPSQPVRAEVEIRGGGVTLQRIDVSSARREGALDEAAAAALVRARAGSPWVVRRGGARVVYELTAGGAAGSAGRLAAGREVAVLSARPVSSTIAAPVVAQELRNNCETASLETLMATVGRRVYQGELQAALRRSGPLDPVGTGDARVWGDPEEGYVGRAEGGGVAGGFGVYQRPIMDLAARYGVRLLDLTGRPLEEIVARVRGGTAVMVWIGLSDGPYGRWTSPSGRPVEVNFGEHTLVLAGVTADGRLRVVNPLQGTRELWTQEDLALMWDRLDRRAVSPADGPQPVPGRRPAA